MFDIVIIQLAVNDFESRAQRMKTVEKYLAEIAASNRQPQLVILPELWPTGFSNFDLYYQESELVEGETFSMLAPWAERLNCYILGGSLVERDGNDYYNTSLLINPNGSLAGCYRKIHLFGYQSEECKLLKPGSEIFVLKTRNGTWGLSTCYDLRFPELYRSMVNLEVDTLLVVAAWPMARLEHWLLLNKARAVENLCNLVACNCSGEFKGKRLAGNSLVVDPWGEVIVRAGEEETLLWTQIDPKKPLEVRTEFPALADRCL